MKDKAMAVINADELLEWLESLKTEAESKKRTALIDTAKSFYSGSLSAILDVIQNVERKAFLVNKPADTEEEEK